MSHQPFKSAIRTTLRSFGYDVMPFPVDDWFEQRITIGKHLLKVFSHGNINCVFDVGAHHGEYANFLRDVGYDGHIVSFEPVAANYRVLAQRCSSDPKWRVHHLALGDHDESATINVFHDTELCSFLSPNAYCADHMKKTDLVATTERVDVRRLDSVFDECLSGIVEPSVYLKLDTQGYDMRVLAGCAKRLDQVRALQSELAVMPIYHDMTTYLEAIPLLRHMGFEVSGMYPVSRDWNLRVVEFDCIMVRQPAFEREA